MIMKEKCERVLQTLRDTLLQEEMAERERIKYQLEQAAKARECFYKDKYKSRFRGTKYQRKRVQTPLERSFDLQPERVVVETERMIFREGQGQKFRKHCKRGSGDFNHYKRENTGELSECDERRGKTPHERKLHRIAMTKQVRITRQGCYKVCW